MATWRVEADHLIPGDGDPIPNGVVVTDGSTISYAGPAVDAPPTPQATTVAVPVVMPGLWECHAHFFGVLEPDLDAAVRVDQAVRMARATVDAAQLLDGGVTSVREVGGLGIHLATAINEGTIEGPTIYGAGAVLSTTGGHADLHSLPLSWVHDLEHAGVIVGAVCDGVPEVLKAVRKQLRRNARVIKICASGGVMSEVDHPIHQQFSDEELKAIVEEAARAERVVAAHCHGKPGIMAALRAGVRTIEHGSYLDEEAARAMNDSGAILVSTRFIVDTLVKMTDRMPGYAATKILAIADRHFESMQIAIANGVTMAMGTDIFVSGADMYGRNGIELSHMHKAGLSPLEAIKAATVNGPLTVGPQAPPSGQLAEGYDADLIALSANPLDSLAILGEPSDVTHVWKGGVLKKQP